MTPAPKRRLDEDARVDRRWFIASAAVFVGSLGGLFGVHAVYRATGPHPEVTLFVRRIKLYANKLLRHRFRRPRP
ncbi:MAG TPA: hypothetical protein VKA21_03765 [Candidatus Binatia bacterium]|nr:hypothetical protein [Candidatus Binatia bacterium]